MRFCKRLRPRRWCVKQNGSHNFGSKQPQCSGTSIFDNIFTSTAVSLAAFGHAYSRCSLRSIWYYTIVGRDHRLPSADLMRKRGGNDLFQWSGQITLGVLRSIFITILYAPPQRIIFAYAPMWSCLKQFFLLLWMVSFTRPDNCGVSPMVGATILSLNPLVKPPCTETCHLGSEHSVRHIDFKFNAFYGWCRPACLHCSGVTNRPPRR